MSGSDLIPIGEALADTQRRIMSRPVVNMPGGHKPPVVTDPWDRVVMPTSPYHGCTLDNYVATTDAPQRILEGVRKYTSDIHARRKKPTGRCGLAPWESARIT